MSIGAVSSSGVDLSAMRAHMQEMAAARFAQDDADQSGGLSIEEFTAAQENRPEGPANVAGAPSAEELFSSLDADGDGELTSEEFEAGRPDGPPPPPPPTQTGALSSDTLSSLFSLQEEDETSIRAVSSASSDEDETDLSALQDLASDFLDALNAYLEADAA